MIIDRFSLPGSRRPTNFSKLWEIHRCAGAHDVYESLFRPGVDERRDENGIRYAIVASQDDNDGSLSLL